MGPAGGRRKTASRRATGSNGAIKASTAKRRNSRELERLLDGAPLAVKSPMPRHVEPQLATLVKEAPKGADWLSEIKFDGYRMICRVDGKKVSFSSRNQLDWTTRLSHLVPEMLRLGVANAIFDGEVAARVANGTTSFQAMQNAFRSGHSEQLVYYVFDLLYLNGRNLAQLPLDQRKRLLATLVADEQGPLRYSQDMPGGGPKVFRHACKLGLEGIICKRRDQPYRPGRSTDWVKVKCLNRAEFVVAGFTPPAGSRHGFGALLLGYFDMQKNLKYAGRVGTGFSDRLLTELAKRLKTMEQKESPFVDLKGSTGEARGVHWVAPRLVAEVEFTEWTNDGHLRHPSFQGLREDKAASDVRLERPLAVESVEKPKRRARGKRS